jgi:glycosyltransferase involved in cell wall biosynthesis
MNVLAIVACWRLPVRVVVSERIDPASHVVRGAWATLRICAYRRAAALVTQTPQAAQWFRRHLPGRTMVATIANPVAPLAPVSSSDLVMPEPFLLAAGRLVDQKGFDVLIRAFAQSRARADLHLVIAGEGPLESALRELSVSLGVASRISFPGKVESLPALMERAYAFILSSRYEGFPNVLLEALAVGTPVISTDCPGGPAEILQRGTYGLLVPPEDAAALATAMDTLTTDTQLRARLASTAARAVAPYELGSVLAQWEQVLVPR